MAALVVRSGFGRTLWPYILVLFVVLSRVASFLEIPGTNSMYLLSMFLLFSFAGVSLVLHAHQVLDSQAKMFFILSMPIMLMQIAGVTEWLQTFNTLYVVVGADGSIVRPDIRLLSLYFTSVDELRIESFAGYSQYLSMQSRPPGLTHSSAMLAVYILAGSALYLGRLKEKHVTLSDAILVCVVVFSGSKLVLIGFVMILLFAFLSNAALIRYRLIYILCVLVMMMLLYYIAFPASINHNYGAGAFEISFLARFVDAAIAIIPSLNNHPSIITIKNEYPTLLMNENIVVGSLSGIAVLLKFLPLALIIFFVMSPLVMKGFRICGRASPIRARTSKLMTLVVLVVPFATPLFTSPFYALCVGIALAPIAIGLSHRLRDDFIQKMCIKNYRIIQQ